MKKKHIVFILFFFAIMFCNAQDKLIFKNGTKLTCKIVSVNKNTVTYKANENAIEMVTKSKSEILVAEYANGDVYIFGNEKTAEENAGMKKPDPRSKNSKSKKDISDEQNNMIGTQLFSSFFGRTGLVYERFLNNKQASIAIPLLLTYSPYSSGSTNSPTSYSNSTFNFVTGADLSYYFPTKSKYTKFFVGPRVRYGTDVMLFNVTGLTIQAQNGLLINSMTNPKIAHTIAFGFGFIRIITTPKSNKFDAKQSYPWMSLTYRLNIKW